MALTTDVSKINETQWPNRTNITDPNLVFNSGHVVAIATYSVLMVISAIGNITVLSTILRRRRKTRSRINTMLMHLAIADLIVTFLMMPLEIVWNWHVQWVFGDVWCRITAFFRIFGLFLSGFILICISVDRYLAVLKPLSLSQVDRRGKIMLASAWIASIICSAPQVYVFHVEEHPTEANFTQCVTFHSFPSKAYENAYNYFGMIMMYCLPLLAIIYCYAAILVEIYQRSQSIDNIRRSGLGFLGRAKSRTLKMTIIIVVVFIICWTPYYIMCVWFWTEPVTANDIDHRIQKTLFMFASTNSCANPIVYGLFNIKTRRGANQVGGSRGGRGGKKSLASVASYSSDQYNFTNMSLSIRTVE
uniref:Gonadotropin-releasing hormone II receptor n=1 Tax=Cacopsylla melanoneura TaxID=428564 RepID=A0A8D8L7K1_9HEMI